MAVTVPFVGCQCDGQVGPEEPPKQPPKSVPTAHAKAQKLAYYRAAPTVGVLGPRGWHCFGVYGSGGDTLFVTPQPIDAAHILRDWKAPSGPAIAISRSYGGTSGRYHVAQIIARVFPAYWEFVKGVREMFDEPASSFPSGPYPADTLTYKSKRVVEYRTPAQTQGLGTESRLSKGDAPIYGVAMLVGQDPDLLILSVRLPPEWSDLAPVIISQLERDAAHLGN